MSKTPLNVQDVKPDVEKAKRIYRAAVDTMRRLDAIQKEKKAYRDVFRQDAVGLRTRLKEYCERLMFFDPALYGRKAEEVLWRKVFYDIIQLVKRNRKHIRSHGPVESAFRTHMASATGYYQHILCRLQAEYGLNYEHILDFMLLPSSKIVKPDNHRKAGVERGVSEWASKACHRCLLYLGDVARYQHSFDGCMSAGIAERYYYQALALFPNIGMPHNQLGTLAGSRYYHCEAAYHYIRCMVSEFSFEGAQLNLERLFEKNRKRFYDLSLSSNNPRDLPPDQQRSRDVKRFFIRFMFLLDIFFSAHQSDDIYEIQEHCQNVLQDFDLCMFYTCEGPGVVASGHTPAFLDDDIIFKVFIMTMASIHYQQKNSSRQIPAAIAFLLALISHLLNHLTSRLQNSLQDVENPTQLPHVDADDGDDNGVMRMNSREDDDDDDDDDNIYKDRRSNANANDAHPLTEHSSKLVDEKLKDKSTEKNRGGRLKNFRRRRKRQESISSEDSFPSSEDLNLSEDERLSDNEMSLSDESEEDFIDYLAADSDSDFEETLSKAESILSETFNTTDAMNQNQNASTAAVPAYPVGNMTSSKGGNLMLTRTDNSSRNIWSTEGVDEGLALFSSELFTSATSASFPGCGNIKWAKTAENGVLDSEQKLKVNGLLKENDESPDESVYDAEIMEKLANYVIETDTENLLHTDNEQFSETDTENEHSSITSGLDDVDREVQHTHLVLELLHQEGLLPIVKVVTDWMKGHLHIVKTTAQSSKSLWSRLAVFLNYLPRPEQLITAPSLVLGRRMQGHIQRSMDDTMTWTQCYPLCEDINLQYFVPVQDAHTDIDFTVMTKTTLSEDQELVLRLCCVQKFGHFIRTLNEVEVKYNEKTGKFTGPQDPALGGVHEPSLNPQECKMKRRGVIGSPIEPPILLASAESRRHQLMKDMAQLRLQSEVSQLEGSLESADQPMFPPYLIPDRSALCECLSTVKVLSQTARCIIIIPLAVIDSLDMLKKESPGARDAIRWLEIEFHKGNRYIRAQKTHEKTDSAPKRNLKKKNRDAWCLLEILDCARFLLQQSGNMASTNAMATILMGQNMGYITEMPTTKPAITACQKEGINIESIKEFHNKWRCIWKSNG